MLQVVVRDFAGERDFGAGANADLVALATFSGDFGEEGRPLDVFVAKTHGNLVLARGSGQVVDGDGAVFVVRVFDL